MNKIKAYFRKKETLDTLKFMAILVVLYFVVTLSFTFVPLLNKYDSFSIQTGSMEPIISIGDVVITKQTAPRDLEVGDITAFYTDINNDGISEVVVHYIDEINLSDSTFTFKTKPHISDEQDSWTIEEDDIIGVYQANVPYIGKVLLFLQSWIGKVVLLMDVLIISIIYDAIFKKSKKEDVEEDEKNKTNNDKRIP